MRKWLFSLLGLLLHLQPVWGRQNSSTDIDVSCGLERIVQVVLSEGSSMQKNRYYTAQNMAVIAGCRLVIEVMSGDFPPAFSVTLPDGSTLQDDNPHGNNHLYHETAIRQNGDMHIEMWTLKEGQSGAITLRVMPLARYTKPEEIYLQPYVEETASAPPARRSVDVQENLYFADLSEQDETYGNAAADFYRLSVPAEQALTISYGEADSSGLEAFNMVLYTPDGEKFRAEGKKGAQIQFTAKTAGTAYLAATTYWMGGWLGAYYLQIDGLAEPLTRIMTHVPRQEFLASMLRNGRPLCHAAQITMGERAPTLTDQLFTPETFNPGFLEFVIGQLVNQERKKENLPAYSYHAILNKSSRQHSEEMAQLDYTSHDSPLPEFASAQERMKKKFAYPGKKCAENIGQMERLIYESPTFSYDDVAEEIMQMWLNSAGHRRQIMRTDLSCLGVGCAMILLKDRAVFYFTQNFGSR